MEAFGLVVRYSGMATSTAIVSRYKYCIVEDCHAVSTLLLDPAYCGMVLKALRHFFRKVNVLLATCFFPRMKLETIIRSLVL